MTPTQCGVHVHSLKIHMMTLQRGLIGYQFLASPRVREYFDDE